MQNRKNASKALDETLRKILLRLYILRSAQSQEILGNLGKRRGKKSKRPNSSRNNMTMWGSVESNVINRRYVYGRIRRIEKLNSYGHGRSWENYFEPEFRVNSSCKNRSSEASLSILFLAPYISLVYPLV